MLKFVQPVLDASEDQSRINVQGANSASLAFLAWQLLPEVKRPVFIVTDGPRSLDKLYQDLFTLGGQTVEQLHYYPGWEALPGKHNSWNQDLAGDRLQALHVLCQKKEEGFIVATSIQALMQKTISKQQLNDSLIELFTGKEIELEPMSEQLERIGYEFVPEVENKGEASRRGGLFDIWPADQVYPLRVELFGNEIESIRQFDPIEQRSIGKVKEFTVTPPVDFFHNKSAGQQASSFFEFTDKDSIWLLQNPQELEQHSNTYFNTLEESESAEYILPWESCHQLISQHSLVIEHDELLNSDAAIDLGITQIEGLSAAPDAHEEHERLIEARNKMVASLKKKKAQKTNIFFHTEGAKTRFEENYFNHKVPDHISIMVSPLSDGFEIRQDKLTVLTESDLYGFRKNIRGKYDPHSNTRRGPKNIGKRIQDWTDIEPGELVVHVDHGIGKYLGLYEMTFRGREQETLVIEYAQAAKLYLPVSQSHLLSRYIGVGKSNPSLHNLGSKRWQRDKVIANKAVEDLAAQMLEKQARRKLLPGHAFSPDKEWQEAFEATFPYQETSDQLETIQTIKAQMEDSRPMDHLVCGDVGYGKTEVAMRAAFKAVMDGKQVCMLAPTTILAQQHFNSFQERMASFPVTIEMMSRFRTKGQQEENLKLLNSGGIDIIVGTHRLFQEDIRFKNLGLVIIDEEQKFGVAHKERIKNLQELVDIITLSATPIPRTLYMSLTGAREMSVISTPPKARLPINTIVQSYSDEIVRKAILMEISREGQIFFLHNRVKTIERTKKHLEELIPEARFEFAHGQMSSRELESAVKRFVNGDFDVFVCTTIIESGIDIPNANTIIIDRADRFGMSDLYQLRGRVGRDKHQAYAYLLLPETGGVNHVARQRVNALGKYSSLGAGFKLALRDLEIRGAGNMLGSEQSGHITAIGFDLYCQLLDRTVKQMNNEDIPPIVEVDLKLDFLDLSPQNHEDPMAAVIPIDYCEDESMRVEIYRKLAALNTLEGIKQLREEMKDRFGRAPDCVRNLYLLAEIRISAAAKSIQQIEVRDKKLMCKKPGGYIMYEGRFPQLTKKTAKELLKQIITFIQTR